MSFERNDEYMLKITMDAFEQQVILDADVRIMNYRGKLKAYCENTKTFLQFPKALRPFGGKCYVADVVKAKGNDRKVFFRAYKGSIRDEKGNVVG